ncbi:patatin-like phospholipase family protein [Brevundimonas sp.]|uniref:patatin-like phospholipase family protein n=1 Tax=Brevundimonas sp. TaxID=1871086 RepID=UPI002D544527|nr:patatin-like phospholipase family protein [Brevundimonas sp.]HYC67023.1 patatin-like phospholipase family protein [Brevundimonas sp.]
MAQPRSDRLEDALQRIFEGGKNTQASWFALTGGETLFAEGDTADTLYLVRSGRLGVFRPNPDEDRPPQFVGVIRPGEPAGEMAMLAGTEHTADVVALRDSEVLALPRDAFFEAARTEPDLMVELSRLMIQRARDRRSGGGEPSVFGFLSARPRPIRAFVERIAAAIEADGFSCQVIDQSALSSASEWFSRVEDAHDYVLYVAEMDEPAWAALCARQVDRVFVVGAGLMAPPNRPLPHAGVLDAQRRTDLILLRDPRMAHPANTGVWIDAISPGRWFQAVEGDQADAERMGRVITGSAVGVVMSGGGARAYSHIGALRALREAGVPIDFVGGASMGAVIAAGPALNWSQEELEARIRKAFVQSDPLSDLAFPMLAMTRAKKVDRLLEEAYGDVDLADLHRPFFAVSTNLTSGKLEVHRRGLMRRAMRASIAIPGILPPVVMNGQVLVDGAVLKNLPAEVMRQMNSGPVIGIDMSEARGVDPAVIEHPPSIWRLIATGAWRRGPPIVSILMRSATLTTDADLESSRAATDLLIQPTPDGVDIRDWKGFDPGVEAGYRATREALDGLDRPVTQLRRRAPISVCAPAETDAETASASSRPPAAETPRKAARRARREKPTA